jgi:hypothetical protein
MVKEEETIEDNCVTIGYHRVAFAQQVYHHDQNYCPQNDPKPHRQLLIIWVNNYDNKPFGLLIEQIDRR